MTFHHFIAGREISAEGYPFYGIIQAAMRQADSTNLAKLMVAFPDVWDELQARYNAPGGALPGDMIPSSGQLRDEVWATLDPKPAASNEAGSRGPGVRMLSGSVVDWVRWLNDGMPGDTAESPVSATHETEAGA